MSGVIMRQDFVSSSQPLPLPEGFTGCYDGPVMRDVVERCFHNSDVGQSHALFLVDVEGYAALSAMGGQAAETLLHHVVSTLHSTFRRSDCIGRLGRHAFLVLLRDVEAQKFSEKKAREFREELNRHFAVCDARSFGSVCSIGVGRYPEHGKTFDEVFRHAAGVLKMARRQRGGASAAQDA